MIELVDTDMWIGYLNDDPVRPHIPMSYRISDNKKTFILLSEDYEPRAMICTAFTNTVATSEKELDNSGESTVMFYTVWSYDRGAGREIISSVTDWIKENSPNTKRFVTLSPPTDMARRFHTRNGAIELQVNEETVNYEYKV